MAERTKPPRADAVRSRRESRDQRTRPRKYAADALPTVPVKKTAHSAPVLMRGVKADLPVRPRQHSRVRRRFDLPLRTPGSEVRLPTVPLVRAGWRWLSGLLSAGLIALLAWLWTAPPFQVGAIEVQGLQRLEAREVNLVLGIQNRPIFVLNPLLLERDLTAAFPEFTAVDVRIGLPGKVTIAVEERQPVLGWLNPQGLVLLDAGGMSFPARGLVNDQGDDAAAGGQRLPVIEAPKMVMAPDPETEEAGQPLNPYVGRQLLTPVQVEGVLQMSAAAPAGARLIFDPDHGMGWEDPEGWVVYFGADGLEMPARLQMYTTIVADLQDRKITPAMISVEFLHAPYYRMER